MDGQEAVYLNPCNSKRWMARRLSEQFDKFLKLPGIVIFVDIKLDKF